MTLATRKPLKAISGRPRKCAVRTCRAPFVPTQSFQSWCSPECGVQIARDKQQKERTALAKIERKAIKARKEKLKGRAEHMKEAQAAFNSWVRERLRISPSCPLILSFHVALDQAREKARGELKIGTTGRGIGPAYEDKVARRGLRVGDLLNMPRFEAKLRELVDYHNFMLVGYYKEPAIDFDKTLAECKEYAELLKPLMLDVTAELHDLRRAGKDIMFEGAQGSLLDIDHGTYPYVTSSNTTAGGVATGSGVGPMFLDYILGITKAYTTRVGSGPFPTELFDDVGAHLAKQGHEFGATTGRARRCGWFDAVILRRAIDVNSISGICLTKLDVLDGLETINICVGYKDADGNEIAPTDADSYVGLQPVYEEVPGWTESTVGAKTLEELPANARAYIKRVEALIGAPIDIISTGPDRNETIVLRHPFA